MEFCNYVLTFPTLFTFNLRYPVELTAITGTSGGRVGHIVLWGFKRRMGSFTRGFWDSKQQIVFFFFSI